MRRLSMLAAVVLLAGCSARLSFIDRNTGMNYTGSTGDTMKNNGTASAVIEGAEYSGEWVFSRAGGGYMLGTVTGSATSIGAGQVNRGFSTGTYSGTALSAQGNGLMTLRSGSGAHLRCVFDFNTSSGTGIGNCQRNDGRLYDLTIAR